MTAEQFTYWLQGFSELNGTKRPSAAQWAAINDHLKQVFVKVTPNYNFGQPAIRTLELRPSDTNISPLITC